MSEAIYFLSAGSHSAIEWFMFLFNSPMTASVTVLGLCVLISSFKAIGVICREVWRGLRGLFV
jgi:hypothetical protein